MTCTEEVLERVRIRSRLDLIRRSFQIVISEGELRVVLVSKVFLLSNEIKSVNPPQKLTESFSLLSKKISY